MDYHHPPRDVFRRILCFETPAALQAVLVARSLQINSSVQLCTENNNSTYAVSDLIASGTQYKSLEQG